MISSITGNGRTTKRMEEEDSFGVMEPFTKAIGRMIWPMEEEDLSKLEEMSMRESGSMISSTAMETRNGQMELNTKETMFRE